MRDNEIHELALACWSVVLPPNQTRCNQIETGELGDLLHLVFKPLDLTFVQRLAPGIRTPF